MEVRRRKALSFCSNALHKLGIRCWRVLHKPFAEGALDAHWLTFATTSNFNVNMATSDRVDASNKAIDLVNLMNDPASLCANR